MYPCAKFGYLAPDRVTAGSRNINKPTYRAFVFYSKIKSFVSRDKNTNYLIKNSFSDFFYRHTEVNKYYLKQSMIELLLAFLFLPKKYEYTRGVTVGFELFIGELWFFICFVCFFGEFLSFTRIHFNKSMPKPPSSSYRIICAWYPLDFPRDCTKAFMQPPCKSIWEHYFLDARFYQRTKKATSQL